MRTKKIKTNYTFLAAMILSILSIFGCSDNDSSSPMSSYLISVTNLTNNQPLSPPAFILHDNEYAAWQIGENASTELEELAESGNPVPLLAAAAKNVHVIATSQGASVIGPGSSTDVEIAIYNNSETLLSFASMLVNTNDAMTGVLGVPVGTLTINESITLFGISYDAGTEVNSETSETIPGPAGGGEGFNPIRNDSGYLSVHSGVVTEADGLLDSTLEESHRWQNPVVRVIVTRKK